jgi:hypothetical protein
MRKILLALAILAGLTAPAFAQPKTIPALTPLGPLTGAETVPACTTVPCGSTTTGAIAALGMPKAGSNLTFAVATTGSDANPCTTLLPCASMQRAWDTARSFDYQHLYFPTIQVADGAYTKAASALTTIGNLINPPPQLFYPSNVYITGNPTTPSNVIMDVTGTAGWSFNDGLALNIEVNGFQFNVDTSAARTISVFLINFDNCIINLMGAGNGSAVFDFGSTSAASVGNSPVTIQGTSGAGDFTNFVFVGHGKTDISNIIVSNPVTFSQFVNGSYGGTVSISTAAIVNPGNIVGGGFSLSDNSSMSADVDPPAFVGTFALSVYDNTSTWTNGTTNTLNTFLGIPVSGAPSTAQLSQSTFGIFKDTTQGPGLGITLKYNDAGTLYDVGPGVIATGSPPTLTGTCTTASQVGANTAGTFTATCVAQTVIITFATTAPNGWTCNAHDLSTPTDALNQTATSATSCTLTGTTVASDRISFNAVGF